MDYPVPRGFQGNVIINDKLFLFGGKIGPNDTHGSVLSDMWMLNTTVIIDSVDPKPSSPEVILINSSIANNNDEIIIIATIVPIVVVSIGAIIFILFIRKKRRERFAL